MRIRTMGLAALLAASGLNCLTSNAQVPVSKTDRTQAHADHDHAHDHAAHAHSGELVAFALTSWKTMHFDDAKKATQHAETVKKLGCELKQGKHDGHIDVSYRCAQWRTMTVPDHKMAEQWIGWLKASGFDVSHAHTDPSYTTGNEIVEFRLMSWKSVHGKGGTEESQLIERLNKIGCEVVTSQHAGHTDIKYRAPVWRDVHVVDHAKAEELMTWLKQNGFEVAPHKH